MVQSIRRFYIVQLVTIQMIVKRDSSVMLEHQLAEVGNIIHQKVYLNIHV